VSYKPWTGHDGHYEFDWLCLSTADRARWSLRVRLVVFICSCRLHEHNQAKFVPAE
jgi:hypothetical protein